MAPLIGPEATQSGVVPHEAIETMQSAGESVYNLRTTPGGSVERPPGDGWIDHGSADTLQWVAEPIA